MAIKGKGKTRSRRMVAAPPRPQLMVRKPPIWRRPVTWVIVGAVLAAAIGYGAWKTIGDHRAASLKAQEIAAVEKYNSLVSGQYPQDQQQLGGSTLQIFTSVGPELDRIDKGQVPASQIKSEAKNFGDTASKAADAIGAIDATKTIPNKLSVGESTGLHAPGLTQLTLAESQRYMVQAFKIYASVAGLMAVAADTPVGPRRTAVIAQAKSLMDTANTLFDRGHTMIANIRTVLGTQVETPLQVPTSPPSPQTSPTTGKKHHKKKHGANATASPTP